MTKAQTYVLPSFDSTHPPPQSAKIKTVADLVDFNADRNPDHVFCLQAEKDLAGSKCPPFLRISHRLFRSMILSCQQWMQQHLSELNSPSIHVEGHVVRGAPIALLVDSDVGLLVHLFALVGLGVPAILLSTRLSPLAIQSLLQETSSCAIITSSRLEGAAKEAISMYGSTVNPPTIYVQHPYRWFTKTFSTSDHTDLAQESLFNRQIAREHHYTSDTDRSVLFLHTSGTTGLPKAVPQSHRYLLHFAPYSSFEFKGIDALRDAQTTAFSTLPLYHCYGLMVPMMSLSVGKPFAIPPSGFVPSATSTVKFLRFVNASTLFIVPSILQEIADLQEGDGVEALRPLDYIACGGGSLPDRVGDKLYNSGIKIINGFGSTEAGSMGILESPGSDRDWRYFRLRKDLQTTVSDAEPAARSAGVSRFRISIRPPGWEEDIMLNDYFTTSNKRLGQDFRPAERADDVLILSTGEKVQPQRLEEVLTAHRNVRAALAFGDNRLEIGVLVESLHPMADNEVESFKKDIWPTIMEAGLAMDAHAQISSSDSIVVLKKHQSFPRSGKDSILRRAAYDMFSVEIEAMYQRLENGRMGESIDLLGGDTEEKVLQYIQANIWKSHAKPLNTTDDLFELGMDSLQATKLRRYLIAALHQSINPQARRVRIPRDFLYSHSTICQIAAALCGTLEKPAYNSDELSRILDEYAQLQQPVSKPKPATVLLTGASGALGAHLLAQLASTPTVERIICLNRPDAYGANPYIRQFKANIIKGAPMALSAVDKVEVLEANTALPFLGLSPPMYWGIASAITHIIHNAWPVDFKRTVSSFESQFKNMSNLLALARDSGSATRFVFVSSIATVAQSQGESGGAIAVPEMPFQSTWTPPSMGYGQAKLVCEKMLERAAQNDEVNGAIVRCAQISGAESSGFWNASEYFPTLVRNSKAVRALPELEGASSTLSWLPLEYAAATLTDILLLDSAHKEQRFVYHVENPVRQSWDSVLTPLSTQLRLPIVAYQEWLSRLRVLSEDGDSMDQEVNGVHDTLFDFFENEFLQVGSGKLYLDTTYTKKASKTLAEVGPIGLDLVRKYFG
ncbi:acetyl-CoA synthetase-like protein [Amniculicola lignicola CBS 123094]|uniref:Acetyl-CoA synthetase-like protein n=1 Tax=Amniculicola lignicola CBS 123094 TaxID=1392246 RepID=A0A6A5WZM1_9PLEO|nr:acetyl-CoA synthetase-like protein [Amniculicola lignicola CBS 123094]